jgi:hypothetical protein
MSAISSTKAAVSATATNGTHPPTGTPSPIPSSLESEGRLETEALQAGFSSALALALVAAVVLL